MSIAVFDFDFKHKETGVCGECAQCEIIDPEKSGRLEAYVEKLVEVRRKKNVTPDMARDFLHDPNYFGTVSSPHIFFIWAR